MPPTNASFAAANAPAPTFRTGTSFTASAKDRDRTAGRSRSHGIAFAGFSAPMTDPAASPIDARKSPCVLCGARGAADTVRVDLDPFGNAAGRAWPVMVPTGADRPVGDWRDANSVHVGAPGVPTSHGS